MYIGMSLNHHRNTASVIADPYDWRLKVRTNAMYLHTFLFSFSFLLAYPSMLAGSVNKGRRRNLIQTQYIFESGAKVVDSFKRDKERLKEREREKQCECNRYIDSVSEKEIDREQEERERERDIERANHGLEVGS